MLRNRFARQDLRREAALWGSILAYRLQPRSHRHLKNLIHSTVRRTETDSTTECRLSDYWPDTRLDMNLERAPNRY